MTRTAGAWRWSLRGTNADVVKAGGARGHPLPRAALVNMRAITVLKSELASVSISAAKITTEERRRRRTKDVPRSGRGRNATCVFVSMGDAFEAGT